ncbi:MAG: hypothetical protein ABI333_17495 [bacterium]
MTRLSKPILLLLALAVGGFAPGCGASKEKKMKQLKEYDKESGPIVRKGFESYGKLGWWLSSYQKKEHAKFEKKIGGRLEDYKGLIDRMKAVKAPNKELEKFKENDLKILHAIKDIFKEFKGQLKEGKRPHRNKNVQALEAEYRQRNIKYYEMRRDYWKKYGKTQKKWKKGKKHKKKKDKW